MSLTRDDDPYTGEIFRSNDPLDDGKRVRVVEVAPPTAWSKPGETYYYYRRVNEYGEEVGPKRRVRTSKTHLDEAFTKVSH